MEDASRNADSNASAAASRMFRMATSRIMRGFVRVGSDPNQEWTTTCLRNRLVPEKAENKGSMARAILLHGSDADKAAKQRLAGPEISEAWVAQSLAGRRLLASRNDR
jgi:hypothetical protein